MTPKRKLTLKKEVVTSLSNNNQILGGYINPVSNKCVHPQSYNESECLNSVCLCLESKVCASAICKPEATVETLCNCGIKVPVEETFLCNAGGTFPCMK